MNADTRLALTGLQFHWHNICEIRLSPGGKRWTAVRIDTPNVSLAAGGCMELKELMENDHAERKPPARRLMRESASL